MMNDNSNQPKQVTIPIQVRDFEGIMMIEEKILENGNLECHSGYYIKNKNNGDILAGLAGDPEELQKQIISRVKNYYPEESEQE